MLHNQTDSSCIMRTNSFKIPDINYCNGSGNNSISFDEECINDCPLECESTIYDKEITIEEPSKLHDSYFENISFKNETIKSFI